MKFTIDAEAFADAISWAARFLPFVPTMPVLAGIRLEATDQQLAVSVFDYEVSAYAQVPAEVSDPGTALVSGRVLTEIAKRLRAGAVEVALDGATMTLRSGPASFGLLTMPVEDYPTIPAMPPTVGQVDASVLTRAITQTGIAAAHDHTVPTLCSLRLDLAPQGPPMLSGTDRYRVALRRLTGWQPTITPTGNTAAHGRPENDREDGEAPASGLGGDPVKVFVYAATMTRIAKALTGDLPVTVGLAADHNQAPHLIGLQVPGRTITTRLMDGAVLDYASMLENKQRPHRVEIGTREFIEAVQRVAVVAERNTPVRLSFTTVQDGPDGQSEMTLQAGTGDEANGRDVLPARVHGTPPTVAFNPGYLTDALNALDSDTAHLFIGDKDTTSALITGTVPDNAKNLNAVIYRHYLMPVRLTS
ncbi:DNA polymerase III subunit beta [Spirillospora sp. CA-142024]|uniref:DNA polymerase III subunit beta n=1 Tax=Spirillospora sp. CA-142024 TaxID=3240036 RepID=UPI003D8A157C